MTLSAGNTDVDTCARALVCLGLKPINSLLGDDDKVVTCRTLYPMVRKEVLSRYPWRYTIAKRQLVRLTSTPVNEYKYAFQLPSDRLAGPRAVFSSGLSGAPTIKEYDIYQDHLYTNEPAIWIDYQASQNESKDPPYVQTLMVYVMAARLAEPLTDDSSKGERWDMMAYGSPAEKQMGGYFETAKALDAQQRPSQEISGDYSLIQVR
jgi:hypothetical protein